MALPDATIDDGVLEGLRRREGAEGVRDGRTRLAKPLGELFLGQLVGLHQQLVGARRFARSWLPEQDVEPAPKSGPRHQAIAPPTTSGSVLCSLARSSRVRSS